MPGLFIILVIIYPRWQENCLYFDIANSTKKIAEEAIPFPSKGLVPGLHLMASNSLHICTQQEKGGLQV